MSFPQAAVSVVHDSTPHPSAPDVLAAKDAEIARLKNEIDTLKASVSPKAATAPELAAAAHTERTQPLPSDTTDQGNLSTPLSLCAVSST